MPPLDDIHKCNKEHDIETIKAEQIDIRLKAEKLLILFETVVGTPSSPGSVVLAIDKTTEEVKRLDARINGALNKIAEHIHEGEKPGGHRERLEETRKDLEVSKNALMDLERRLANEELAKKDLKKSIADADEKRTKSFEDFTKNINGKLWKTAIISGLVASFANLSLKEIISLSKLSNFTWVHEIFTTINL